MNRNPQRHLTEEGSVAFVLEDLSEELEQVWESIRPFLERLRPKYKEAAELCLKKNLPRAEAAVRSRWPCSGGATSTRLFRAKQELRDLLTEGGIL